MPSFTVENYVKAIYALGLKQEGGVSTNAIAEAIGTKPATVSDMLRKLKERGLIHYERYQGTRLSEKGRSLALQIIRKHRLWEVFLVNNLNFKWDEVHDMAEELEHIHSDELIDRLEDYLGHPKFDPHGDPIPSREGKVDRRDQIPISELQVGERGTVTGVKDSSKEFLQYLDQINIELGHSLEVRNVIAYDQSRVIFTEGKEISLSQQVCINLFVIKD